LHSVMAGARGDHFNDHMPWIIISYAISHK
jgi:hypothetical protein